MGQQLLHRAPHLRQGRWLLPPPAAGAALLILGQDVELAPELGVAQALGEARLVQANGVENLRATKLKKEQSKKHV